MNAYADLTTLKSESYLGGGGASISVTHDTYLRKLLEMASRQIDNECKRFFYCWEGTRYYRGAGTRIFLDDILTITTLKTDEDGDGTFENTLTEDTDFFLFPLNETTKEWAEINPDGDYGSFGAGTKRGVEVVGIFGYGDGWSTTPYNDAGTDVDESGDVTTTQTTIKVDNGDKFADGQTIRIDSEQMYISSIGTNTLTVTRAVNGTTAATHTDNTDIYIYDYPEPITQACLITAMRAWKRKDTAYQDIVGGGELGALVTSKGIDPDVKIIIGKYRKVRV